MPEESYIKDKKIYVTRENSIEKLLMSQILFHFEI